MQIPVLGYRYKKKVPLAYATLDAESVAAMESYAGEKIVLRFGKTGEVMLPLKYCEYSLESNRSGKKQFSRLVNYILGRLPLMHIRPGSVLFRDGNVMNFSRDNIYCL